MAWTGVVFVLFVLAHMYGNLKLLSGQQAFDEYAHHLRVFGEPMLPENGLLWVMRTVLLVAVIIHVYAAVTLWARAKGARSIRYEAHKYVQASISSRWMRWGGVTILLFVIFHLIHFTIVKPNVNADYTQAQIDASPYIMATASFKLWWVVLIYVLAMLALGMHISHGVWSSMQTLGWTNSPKARTTAKGVAHIAAAVVVIGFLIPPLAIAFGLIAK